MSDTQPTAAQPEPPAPPPPSPTGPPGPPPAWTPASPAPPRPRLRDRVFGLRSLIAVGVAGVILGGLAGFAIHAATDDDRRDGRMGRFGPGFGPRGGFGQGPGRFPDGGQGQFPGGPGQQGPGQFPTQGSTPSPPQPPTSAPSQ